jgi:hypothetical protein
LDNNSPKPRVRSSASTARALRGAFAISDDSKGKEGVEGMQAAGTTAQCDSSASGPVASSATILDGSGQEQHVDPASGAIEGCPEDWHGYGMLEWQDGRRYVGQFSYGRFDGEGTMNWPDGRRYVGSYRQNKKHGKGEFVWPDGRRYSGEWIGGYRHGNGTYTNARGEKRCGRWSQDRPVAWEDEILNKENNHSKSAASATMSLSLRSKFGGA